jgi:sulfur carrier protein
MHVLINHIRHELAEGTTLAEALALVNACSPFAAAINLAFVPKNSYEQTLLQEGDQIEIIAPITGG